MESDKTIMTEDGGETKCENQMTVRKGKRKGDNGLESENIDKITLPTKKKKSSYDIGETTTEEKPAKKKKTREEKVNDTLNEELKKPKRKKEEKNVDKQSQEEEKEKKKKKEKKEIDEKSKPKKGKDKKDDDASMRKGNLGGEERKLVLDYMISQNRPYSLINIFDNLHGNIKKKQLERILDALVEDKEMICKEYLSKIYLVAQHHFPEIDKDELIKIEEETENTRENITKLKEKLLALQNQLKFINTQLTDEELDRQIEINTKTFNILANNLLQWETGVIEKIADGIIDSADKEYDRCKNNYKKSKKICLNIIDSFCEGMDVGRDELIKAIGGFENETELLATLKNK